MTLFKYNLSLGTHKIPGKLVNIAGNFKPGIVYEY